MKKFRIGFAMLAIVLMNQEQIDAGAAGQTGGAAK